jgi:hypothetical protein
MYKYQINLENFRHKLVLIFQEDGNMALHMSFLFLGIGKMVLDTWWLHHSGISCDHMVCPKDLSNETQRQVTCNIQAQKQSATGVQDISPMRNSGEMS